MIIRMPDSYANGELWHKWGNTCSRKATQKTARKKKNVVDSLLTSY